MTTRGIHGSAGSEELKRGLEKTRLSFLSKLTRLVAGRSSINEDLLDELEETLVSSDVGVETTVRIIRRLQERVARDKYLNITELRQLLREEMASLLEENKNLPVAEFSSHLPSKPWVILIVGVNGAGKTTTIGKLAWHYKKAGRKVLLGAADTFRAAAIDQLSIWSERAGVPLVRQQMGSDPASVAYDTLRSAIASETEIVLIDTAGRLHNKINLMNELAKIRRVLEKLIPEAPHEVILVLDGSTGQNAFEQAKQFTSSTGITALAITKLDGTAKGGVVIGISDQLNIPVKYIGTGEKLEDLRIFDRHDFINSLFE